MNIPYLSAFSRRYRPQHCHCTSVTLNAYQFSAVLTAPISGYKLATCLTENFKLIVITKSAFLVQLKMHQSIWRQGFARTHWGAYSASPDPITGLRGAGRGGKEYENMNIAVGIFYQDE